MSNMTDSEIDSILNKEMIFDTDIGPNLPRTKQKLQTLINKRVIEELDSVLEIPSKYIDDGTMVFWADFTADTLEKIIRDRIAQLKGEDNE